MTDNLYLPEGLLYGTPENREYISSLHSLERARIEGRIVEGIAVMCDSRDFSLRVDLNGITGIMERGETVYGDEIKDIAIITRVGKPIAFKILRIEKDEKGEPTAILSRRAAQLECMANYISYLSPGDIIPARVTHLEPFGAFVDIGCGIVSLLGVDGISVSRISHPRDRLYIREEISVVVKSVDQDTGRICVSQKELLGTWEENASCFEAGQTVAGIVRSVEQYGIFVELAPNLAGLAELCDRADESSVGMGCAVYVKSIIPERMKIKLVLIDTYQIDPAPARPHYFIDTNKVSHIENWRYSPPSSQRIIESVFI